MTLVLDRDPPVAVMKSQETEATYGTGRLQAEKQTLDEMYQPPSKDQT